MSPKGRERPQEGGIPWVTPKDMNTPDVLESAVRISATALAEAGLEPVQPGHVLLVVRGTALAHRLPVAINRVPVTINQDMKAIRPIDDLSPEFLRSCLQWLEPTILARMGTAVHGPKKFGQKEMDWIRIPLPPRSLQDRFSVTVRELEALEPSRKIAAQGIENLFQSLLALAFDGRLFFASGIRETQAGMDELLQELEHRTKA